MHAVPELSSVGAWMPGLAQHHNMFCQYRRYLPPTHSLTHLCIHWYHIPFDQQKQTNLSKRLDRAVDANRAKAID